MKKILAAVALSAGLMGSAHAAVVSTAGEVLASSLAGTNDFLGTLLAGYTYFNDAATLSGVNPGDTINFTVIGAEAGLINTFSFTAGGSHSFTETSWDSGHPNVETYSANMGTYLASTISALLFSSSSGFSAAYGATGFGIFYNHGSVNDMVFAFDDHGAAPEDNHDDLLVRVTFVPEPATWGLMILGFAGLAMARRRSLVRA